MRDIPKKNYIILIMIIILTISATYIMVRLYNSKNSYESQLYRYSNKITYKEFDVYITENPDSIVYISNKSSNDNEEVENELMKKIDRLNLKDYFVYINASNKLINKINKDYKLKLNINELPVILTFLDSKISDYSYINDRTDVDSLINYGDFE